MTNEFELERGAGISADAAWQAVTDRRASADGTFYYGVRTTGIYCRPSCPARRPKRENVVIFSTAEAAEEAGFRACLRCLPAQDDPWQREFRRVRGTCRIIEDRLDAGQPPPTLEELGTLSGTSPFHLQRTFKKTLGLTPREYAEAVRMRRFRAVVRGDGTDVKRAARETGYGSASAVYEQAGERLGMTPDSYRVGGAGRTVRFTTAACPLGRILVAATERGVCAVSMGDSDAELEETLRREFFAAEVRRDDGALGPFLCAALASIADGDAPLHLPLDVRGTAFQVRVWKALRAIPAGQTRTYGEIAAEVGAPGAARAVGSACAANAAALAIPCHRAVRAGTGAGAGTAMNYRWGGERKRKLLEREKSG